MIHLRQPPAFKDSSASASFMPRELQGYDPPDVMLRPLIPGNMEGVASCHSPDSLLFTAQGGGVCARHIPSDRLGRRNAGGSCYGFGADASSDVGGSDKEFGLVPCVLIPAGLTDQPLSSLHEEVRSTPAPMTTIPTTRLRCAFIRERYLLASAS